jgi:nucleoside-diphosphate-sugar epimerase
MSEIDGDIIVIGAAGKMGPTLTRRLKRAIDVAGVKKNVYAVARRPLLEFEGWGIKTLQCGLLEDNAAQKLPEVENVIYMVGRKFGSQGSEWLTWAANTMIPAIIARRYSKSRIVEFSTGCVYPLIHKDTGGSLEQDTPDPIGEYAMSCLGRERIFDYFSAERGTRLAHIRLNYAVELRYGVLVDIAMKVFRGKPVDVTTGYFNAIWQGDACDQIVRCLPYATSPSSVFNVTGPELISVRQTAHQFGKLFDKEVTIIGEENNLGYLSNAAKWLKLFGSPRVSIDILIHWVADWIRHGGENLSKPTHFEVQNGRY